MSDLGKLLTTREAAARLGLSRSRVLQLAAEGRIGQLVGGVYLYTPGELAAFARRPRPVGWPRGLTWEASGRASQTQ